VFLLNSRQGHFTATPQGSEREALHPGGHSFSRSYGVNLPSSLTRVLPIALVCSTYLPVSVCGTGTRISLEAFLDSVGSATSGHKGTAITPQTPGADLPTPIIALRA
jgi:hypothetical protein